jgi:hypothetical protein
MGPESKDPADPSIDLLITQLGRGEAVRIARPQIHPHCHLPSLEWLNAAAYEGA